MKEENCGNCRFYFDGKCRRYPPVAIYEAQYDDYAQQRGLVFSGWHFACIDPAQWCGEYKRSEKEAPASN